MGEHVLKVFLTELQIVRVTCKSCDCTMEVELDKLDVFGEACPFCKSPFYLDSKEAREKRLRLAAFKEAATKLLEMDSKHFGVSFNVKLDVKPADET